MSSEHDYEDLLVFVPESLDIDTLIKNVRDNRSNPARRGKHIKALKQYFIEGCDFSDIDSDNCLALAAVINDCFFPKDINEILRAGNENFEGNNKSLLCFFRRNFLSLSAYPNIKKVAEKIDRELFDDVIRAGAGSDKEIKAAINVAINKGLNINARDRDGYTLLHRAAGSFVSLGVVRYLVNTCGARPYYLNKKGETPDALAKNGGDIQKYLQSKVTDLCNSLNNIRKAGFREMGAEKRKLMNWMRLNINVPIRKITEAESDALLSTLNDYFSESEIKEVFGFSQATVRLEPSSSGFGKNKFIFERFPRIVNGYYDRVKDAIKKSRKEGVPIKELCELSEIVEASRKLMQRNKEAHPVMSIFSNIKHRRMRNVILNYLEETLWAEKQKDSLLYSISPHFDLLQKFSEEEINKVEQSKRGGETLRRGSRGDTYVGDFTSLTKENSSEDGYDSYEGYDEYEELQKEEASRLTSSNAAIMRRILEGDDNSAGSNEEQPGIFPSPFAASGADPLFSLKQMQKKNFLRN
jgi:hypothetical protein